MPDGDIYGVSRQQPAEMLSDAELLAVLLSDSLGTAEAILKHYGGLPALVSAPPLDWKSLTQVREDGTDRLAAALEIARRVKVNWGQQRPVIRTAEDAAQWVVDMRELAQEHVRLILLDMYNRVIATPTIYKGTLNGVVFRPAEVFREVIRHNSPAFILAHNHPAGDPSPTPEDIELTRAVIAAGKLLDIQLLDHLIIAEQGWRSLKQQGLAF